MSIVRFLTDILTTHQVVHYFTSDKKHDVLEVIASLLKFSETDRIDVCSSCIAQIDSSS